VKIARTGGASIALLPLLLAGLSGPALANGVGDLYVATAGGVLEVRVSTSTVVSTIDVLPAPESLAFTPDGKTLYVGSGGAHVTPVDIETLDVGTPIPVPGEVTALAFPAGQILVGSMPTRKSLVFVKVYANTVVESAQLPGPGNLLAADRRDPRVAVAEAGKSWLEIVDPATSTIKKATVAGEIVAIAIDRDHGGALVATQNPNTLVRVDLATLASTWTVTLPGVPTAVAALQGSIVVAGGKTLWLVGTKQAVAWAAAREPVVAMAASDEGGFLHLVEKSGVEVFDSKGKLARTLELDPSREPVALAPVPAGSSLFLGDGSTKSAGPNGTASAAPIGTPGALPTQKPPPTGTILDAAKDVAGYPPIQGAAAVALVILAGYWLAVRWYDKRTGRA
jgi:hypothetical protein